MSSESPKPAHSPVKHAPEAVRTGISTQLAALPWRPTRRGIKVLLVTSRTNARWMLPKGWPIEGLSDAESAAREALEEAGVRGEIASRPLGSYRYMKLLKDEVTALPSQALVYGLKVTEELDAWPEKSERERRWLGPNKAAQMVWEPDLARLLRSLAKGAIFPFEA